jgi:hypothetical protein
MEEQASKRRKTERKVPGSDVIGYFLNRSSNSNTRLIALVLPIIIGACTNQVKPAIALLVHS